MFRGVVSRLGQSAISAVCAVLCAATSVEAQPKVVIISLDGAQPLLVEKYLNTRVPDSDVGLGRSLPMVCRPTGTSPPRRP